MNLLLSIVAFAAVALIAPANAQQSGAVPATCTINAASNSLTCQVTMGLSNISGTFASGALTLNGNSAPSAPSCGSISPASQTVAVSATATTLNSNCTNATSYQWYTGANFASRVSIAAATAATYSPNTASVGSTTYWVTATNATGTTEPTTFATVTVSNALPPAPVCTGITPLAQTVNQGTGATSLNANCTGATSYQWFSGASQATRAAIAGATTATYSPSTATVGTTTYWVDAINSGGTTTPTTSASVVVNAAPPVTSCPAGEPRIAWNYIDRRVDRTDGVIYGNGVYVAKITVSANDSSIGKNILPFLGLVQDDVSGASMRTVTVSASCADFGANAQLVANGDTSPNVRFVTTGDSRSGTSGTATLSPGVWYLNIRNDSCGASQCNFAYSWVNWNQ